MELGMLFQVVDLRIRQRKGHESIVDKYMEVCVTGII